MTTDATSRPAAARAEAAGFLASLAFTVLASVRDVYFGGLFQSTSPLGVAVTAFTLCVVVFLPIALARGPESVRRLLRRPRELFWVNVSTGLAWIAFFHALRAIEPLLAQILFAGVGPLTVVWVDRFVGLTRPAPLGAAERPIYLGLFVSLVLAACVALAGLSGTGPQAPGTAVRGVVLATGAGISISVSTVLSRRLSDGGVSPAALVSLRFVGAIVLAAVLALAGGPAPSAAALAPPGGLVTAEGAVVLGAVLALIVLPIHVNQVGMSLASPLTVRAAMALGPVLIFVLQLVEGRLSPSPYSLAVGVLYGIFAVSAALARRRQGAISAAPRKSPALP
jgi:drug/metabolite transporter (DMT)-like permease